MMEWIKPTASIVSILSFITAAIGIFYAADRFKKQTHLAAFFEFTRRFDEVVKALPEEVRAFHITRRQELPPPSPQQTEALDRVLAILSQEFYLYRKGYLGKDIWMIWEPGIKDILRSPLVARDWDTVRHRYDVFPEFAEYASKVRHEVAADS
jgi:hypothetical protein